MKLRFFITTLCLLLSATLAHSQAQPSATVTPRGAGNYDIDWAGVAGRTYFMQFSTDLVNWNYAPSMDYGAGAQRRGANSNSDKLFVRLPYVDDPTINSLAAAEAADFDRDGISNLAELTSASPTNPLNSAEPSDSDGDGMPNAWEVRYGLNPSNPADAAADGITNIQSFLSGVSPIAPGSQPETNPTELVSRTIESSGFEYYNLREIIIPRSPIIDEANNKPTPTFDIYLHSASLYNYLGKLGFLPACNHETFQCESSSFGLGGRNYIGLSSLFGHVHLKTTGAAAGYGDFLMPHIEQDEDFNQWSRYFGQPYFGYWSDGYGSIFLHESESSRVRRDFFLWTPNAWVAYNNCKHHQLAIYVKEKADKEIKKTHTFLRLVRESIWNSGILSSTCKALEEPTVELTFTIPAGEKGSNVIDLYGSTPEVTARIPPEGQTASVIRQYFLLPVEFITPAGDPVAQPKDTGDGQNEFTFNEASPGVLEINLRVKVPGIGEMPAEIKNKFTFEIDTIGSSIFTWAGANPGGKASVNGDFISATATYTGLPHSNSDFGLKRARVKFDGTNIGEAKIEVFYDAKAKNHTGGDLAHPNWFHYYKQNAGGEAYNYDPTPGARSTSLSAGGDSSIKIGDYVHTLGGQFITTTKIGGLLKATVWSSTNKYYAHFSGVLAHERQHANGEVTQGSATDPDSDWLSTSLETGTSNTNPNDSESASSGVAAVAGFTDDEVYAGGPVEENGIKNADTSKDWANPGTNHKP